MGDYANVPTRLTVKSSVTHLEIVAAKREDQNGLKWHQVNKSL